MPLSLIHFLAARACHADTLKRALLHNPEACRLLACFGVTPTHLEDIAKGNTSRLRAATSTTLADYLLLSARLMVGGLDGTEAAMLRGQMEAPWRALTPKEHEAVRVVGALYDRLAKGERGDLRTQAAFEHQLAEADEHVRILEARLAATEAASEHGLIADLLAMGFDRIEIWRRQRNDTIVANIHLPDGNQLWAEDATAREALLNLRKKVKATLPTKPPEPIVLGPWRTLVQGGAMSSRSVVGGTTDGVRVSADGWAVHDRAGSCVCHGEETGQAGRDAADKWARENGYVLLDAEPGALAGVLPTLRRQTLGCGIYWWRCAAQTDVEVTIYEQAHTGVPGWRILQWLDVGETRSVAHGPQTGEEGKRYALAAAHALGLTGGGE